ncbi:CGNR zinc finger domain-containing protein [Streptomyces griseorubiginosus]|uniref:CGNR zinc finger domain-containing protein n=1 Tax=Streptomyces griseorubiginosus TaxID=67304 RepID=UPI002E7FDBC1|nr:CGNR zinc finger domain-containing protein [Streptomyces griseorubiginosus]WUB50260.1 CGNR zinc finger domain-containing protein [Streptomyces griseorubiginosus]
MNTHPAPTTDADPRPLLGEPLPLDLLNTRWIDDSGAHDLLERPGGLAIWLSSAGLADIAPDTQETLGALLATRTALSSIVASDGPDLERSREMLNDTLGHGRIRRLLGTAGPETLVETDTPGWVAAWRTADLYLHLLEEGPDRIRKCANPECPLRFYDTSRNGGRRWCSMTSCGNRAKTRRHYERHQSTFRRGRATAAGDPSEGA